jgi:DNA-binding transcriptional LysR family regulator
MGYTSKRTVKVDLADWSAFAAVSRAGGFRDAPQASDSSASALSDAVRRLDARLGVRLLNRTTRSVLPTDSGKSLLAWLGPVPDEVGSALDVLNAFRDTPAGTLRLNVPMSAARLVLPSSFRVSSPHIPKSSLR